MKNILLLTDFSDNAKNAIHYALHLFKNEKCIFHLMHVHKIGSFTSDDLMQAPKESVFDSITKEPRENLNNLKEELQENFPNKKHKFETHIDFDVFIDAIKQAIKKNKIDYLVMGTNGASGTKEVILGSNTVHVIRKINCKTLIIPENHEFTPIKELLLPLDPKDAIDGKQFIDLIDFIEIFKLHLHALRVNPNNENTDIESQDIENLALLDCKYHVVNNVPMDFALSSYMQTNTIDFLSLFVKNEGFLDHFFSKANTKINISKVSKPILILHP
ncbi:universal stress protein [Lacinutrix sp. C3R15]|uniref:universal stress protein n=1 Tax=Flavobacteriaceae TaxID=49546 RepID=UPI001C08FAF2|nr:MULTISPECIES: universal stress protein [Flavobacteriaceae]MBU2938937.1 universal stress protein [Lacinutrix sp. C3R15]MDO6622250.1 universal stress protein [Oceanihabitans sp. 1_MG-2023]